jgi:hypothetical protein
MRAPHRRRRRKRDEEEQAPGPRADGLLTQDPRLLTLAELPAALGRLKQISTFTTTVT